MKIKLCLIVIHALIFDNIQKCIACGVDNSKTSKIYEGYGNIATYPWLGTLVYTSDAWNFHTVVVSVSTQLVIGSAGEIDKLPKKHIKEFSKVILGKTCDQPGINIRELIFHSDFKKHTNTALVLIQLETDHVSQDLQPICPPPTYFVNPDFYVVSLSNDCESFKLMLQKVSFVDETECKLFYFIKGLNFQSMWPIHTVCAQTQYGGHCLWRSGNVLMTRQGGRWKLLGFGVYGPGCESPSRFIDYGMHYSWVKQNIDNIGKPAITRVSNNYVIFRRSLSNLQKFGLCESDELKDLLFTHQDTISMNTDDVYTTTYNITLKPKTEYTCIIFQAHSIPPEEENLPKLHIKQQNKHKYPIIEYKIDVEFMETVTYVIHAYGEELKAIDAKMILKFVNQRKEKPKIANQTKMRVLIKHQNQL